MTSKELVYGALHHQKDLPRVPVMTMSGVTWALAHAGLSPKEFLDLPDHGAELLWDTAQELGVDIVYGGRALPFLPMVPLGGAIDYSKTGLPCDLTRKPVDNPEEIPKFSAEDAMKGLKELEEYKKLMRQTELLKEKAGEEMLVGVGSFGPFTTAAQIVGVNEFMLLLAEEDEQVEDLLSFSEDYVVEILLDGLKHGGNLLFLAEPVSSGNLISPSMFEEIALPSIRRVLDRVKDACPEIVLHICGKTMPYVELLRGSGIALLSIDGLPIPEALEKTGGDFGIMGNLSPVHVLQKLTEKEVREQCEKLCRISGAGSGFFLAPGCDLTPATPMENIQAMRKAAERTAMN